LGSSSPDKGRRRIRWFASKEDRAWRQESYAVLQRAADWIIGFRRTGLDRMCPDIYLEVCKYEYLIGHCKCELDGRNRRAVDHLKYEIEMCTTDLLELCMRLTSEGKIPRSLANKAMFPPK
jgi:hypothetical protein